MCVCSSGTNRPPHGHKRADKSDLGTLLPSISSSPTWAVQRPSSLMWVASRPHPLPLPARYSNTKVLIAPQAPHTHSAWLPHTLMLKRLPSTPSPVFILTSPSVLLKFRLGVSSIRKEAFPASISPLDFAVYSFPHASECPCICDPSFNSVCELEVWFNYWSWFTWLTGTSNGLLICLPDLLKPLWPLTHSTAKDLSYQKWCQDPLLQCQRLKILQHFPSAPPTSPLDGAN